MLGLPPDRLQIPEQAHIGILKQALTPAEAAQAILTRSVPSAVEMLPLNRCHGRILRQEISAERDTPPFDRVCMDGVAIRSSAFAAGNRRFRIQATQGAGRAPLALLAADAAIEVMTGAVLPTGTDCVIPVEEFTVAAGELMLRAEATAIPSRNVQRRGTDSHAGDPVLSIGSRLGAAEVAVIASSGLAQVAVSRQPRVMVISTGDELIEPGLPIAAHQVRRSNAYAILASLQEHGLAALAESHLQDDEAAMRLRLATLLDEHDTLILSGGVSKGRFDFVPAVLKSLGVQEVFHHIEQRPGRPMWFGSGPRDQLVFGLPGNPVATLVCLTRYVLPALRAMQMQRTMLRHRVAMVEALVGRRTTFFSPVNLRPDLAPGAASARATRGSGDFLSLAGTDGFIELPPQPEGYAAGFVADFYRW